MKVIILAGGKGTRLSEETSTKPKPMVEIGGLPIIWHIMKIYSYYDFKDFVIALGYKGEIIKDFFLNYRSANSDLTIDLDSGNVHYDKNHRTDWTVTLVDSGKDTLTGGRLLRLEPYLRSEGTFMLTYGDGVANINIAELLSFHQKHGKIATISAVRPPARFGTMRFEGNQVIEFKEKPQTGEGWINGGFFVFEMNIFDYLLNDQTVLETDPLERLAADGQLVAYKHAGFWQCMDVLRDKKRLEELWKYGDAPWKVWD